jgi:hypothetical protein
MGLNYRRAAIAGGSGVVALLAISTTIAILLAISYGLAGNHLLGGGPRYDEILALTALPAAIGVGAALITLTLTYEWLRAIMSTVTGFALSFIVTYGELAADTYSPGYRESSLAWVLVLVPSLSVLIATIRRPNMSLLKVVIIIGFLIAFVIVLGAISILVPESSIYTSIAMAFVAWTIPPAFTGLLLNSYIE